MAFLIFASSFCGTTAVAAQNDFEISGLTPLEKSQSIEGEIANYDGDSFENGLTFHELGTLDSSKDSGFLHLLLTLYFRHLFLCLRLALGLNRMLRIPSFSFLFT